MADYLNDDDLAPICVIQEVTDDLWVCGVFDHVPTTVTLLSAA